MNSELTFILGAMEDGCLIKRENIGDYTIEFDQKNKEWLEILNECFGKVFKKTTHIKKTKRGYYRLSIHSKRIFDKLQKLMKSRMRLIEDSSISCKASFLRGVFDAESSVHPNRFVIALSNKDTDLLRFRKKLLNEFDIGTGSICRSNGDVFEVCIFGGENLQKYKERIGFSHPDRIKKLNRILKRYIGS